MINWIKCSERMPEIKSLIQDDGSMWNREFLLNIEYEDIDFSMPINVRRIGYFCIGEFRLSLGMKNIEHPYKITHWAEINLPEEV